MGNLGSKAKTHLYGINRKVSGWRNVEMALNTEMEEQKLRYKPESLDDLAEKTHFTRNELKWLYQGFKQVTRLFPCTVKVGYNNIRYQNISVKI